MNRRDLLKGSVLAATAFGLGPISSLAADADNATSRLTTLERKHGGRLGVAVLDTGNGHRISHRGDERFLICSTFKL